MEKLNFKRLTMIFVCLLLSPSFFVYGEGSKNVTPALGAGDGAIANTFIGFLMHNQEAGTGGNFLTPEATADERLFVHVREGETLYFGLRRTLPSTIFLNDNPGNLLEDITIIIRENDGTLVNSFLLTADATSTNGATLNAQQGVIASYDEAANGPRAIVGAAGYDALSFTNSGLGDQNFYIEIIQANGGSIDPADNINQESWYDLWDFSVFDGTIEKPGRMFSKIWAFNAGSFANEFSQDFQMFVRIPSIINNIDAGNYIKEIDLAGIEPFAVSVFANTTGADVATLSGFGGADLNGDGVVNFLDARRSLGANIGGLEYDIFISNPDVDIYPTTILPTVSITDAVFFCNDAGTGGAGSITINSNQEGQVALFLNLDETPGFQDGTEDVIIEQLITTEFGIGTTTILWDGLDGLGNAVESGTPIEITGRFTAGALHIPLFDPEINNVGINMIDVRPQTSFDLIYWDDRSSLGLGSSPTAELTGTNTGQHTWNNGNAILVNTWSFGFLQGNTQNVIYSFICDVDGDGLVGAADADADNDGVSDDVEGNPNTDTDGDNVPDYLDSDFAGFIDENNDGVNDNFDSDLDGVPDAIDLDSDNDGIPDAVENGFADTNNDGAITDGSPILDVNGNGFEDTIDPACVAANVNFTGNSTNNFSAAGVPDGPDAEGAVDGSFAIFDAVNDQIVLDMGIDIPSGETVAIRVATTVAGNTVSVAQATSGAGPFDNVQTFSPISIGAPGDDFNYTLTADSRFIRIIMTVDNGGVLGIDALSYNFNQLTNPCGATVGVPVVLVNSDGDAVANYIDIDSDNDGIVDVIEAGGTASADGTIDSFVDNDGNGRNDAQQTIALTIPDFDGDGSFPNYIDIDSDNDGILDNIESQRSNMIIASAAGDTDGDGLLDVYDPNNGGTLISPVNTDGTDNEDYIDTDADDDGVLDFIEGRDSNIDGFSDVDTNNDGSIADETGFSTDSDNDGLLDLFEAVTAPIQNTDGADFADFQDTDDDNDGSLTAGEDLNSNGDFTDDFNQGQGVGATVPDYLFRSDYDGDSIADGADADSDNDGITDATESNGEAIDPSGDEDGDGISNYFDLDDATVTAGLTSTADVNGDGVYDVYDTDLDGVPDFLDLDSDNDGIFDAIEADGGSVPNGLDTNTGQFNLDDPDNDGLMNFVDTDDINPGGVSDLANPDSDMDGVPNYLDIDSDNDGILDIVESQDPAGAVMLTGTDSDGDGIDDAFDPSTGGVLIDPVNTDNQDLRDYLDVDSDNDNVPDIIEGNDLNNDGIADVVFLDIDTDGDGLDDAFDPDNGGTPVALQNTDGVDQRDFRDTDDDNDGFLTSEEDTNGNGNYADDITQGQPGIIPNYLYLGDFDGDGIVDILDSDSDNDGIPDAAEESGGQSVNPSEDNDGDGIPNFRDTDDLSVTGALTSTADINNDGVYDVYDQDLDGVPDFRDRDSDNDGIPDLVEAGGTDVNGDGVIDGLEDTDGDGIFDNVDVDITGGADVDGDGIDDNFDFSIVGGVDSDGDDIIDSADLDRDGDGFPNVVDAEPDNGAVATSLLTVLDSDGDGLGDPFDTDSDGDGIPDLIEAGGTDADGDGRVDDLTDTDFDGFVDSFDSDNGGVTLPIPDTDTDGVADFRDVDSDNDGITDAVENGGVDSNSDGLIDNMTDTDRDGLADIVDPDNGGISIANSDIDGDGIPDFRDLDVDNNGYPDILEGGGIDADNDGIVDASLNSDPLEDTVPDNVDVDLFASNGGSGADIDGDEIDDAFDASITGGSDVDGDGIDDNFDLDVDGNGYIDAIEAAPYGQVDTDNDGNNDYRDIDVDGDGILDVLEFGLVVNAANGQIDGFTDLDGNGWNDAQLTTPINPRNTDGGDNPDFQDIDSDNDGIPDLIESQTQLTFVAPLGNDADLDGLDDAFDPDQEGVLPSPPNTDGVGNEDYRDTDADGDGVLDIIEGANDDRNQFADWDTNNDNLIDNEIGFNVDTDNDGLWDVFDNDSGTGVSNISGSNSDGQDSDLDNIWDFQDTDDDNDGILTSAQGVGGEDVNSDGDRTNDINDDPNGIIPDYLFGNDDPDGDNLANTLDLDSNNDGILDTDEDGGTGIDPSGDIDGDGILNAQDFDIDGDGIPNSSDADADNIGGVDVISLTDANGDGVADQFDKDQDGTPDFLDLDADNDGIANVIEFGLPDTDLDGRIDSFVDLNNNGLIDDFDPFCGPQVLNATAQSNIGAANGNNVIGNDAGTFAQIEFNESITLDFGNVIPSGTTISLFMRDGVGGINAIADVTQSLDGTAFSNTQNYTATVGNTSAPEMFNYTLNADAQFVRVLATGNNLPVDIHLASYSITFCPAVPGLTVPDTDADEIDDYLDLDSDGDGITDNREAQRAATYVAPVLGDADGDGILDVYDEDIAAGNAILPVDTDVAGNGADYLDLDSDEDGIPDNIEGFDANMDGFADWDTNGNNGPSDEIGFDTDADNDGIRLLYDEVSTVSSIANIDGSNSSLQNSDADTIPDFRDIDDDGDGINTEDEDNNSNGIFTDDFTQGGAIIPDYLFNPDLDEDNVLDNIDLDSDNDGILTIDEVDGDLPSPFSDDDNDGLFNYVDSDLPGFIDVNTDGIDDRYDQDRDGIPNFFDLDSDNDGIPDIVEAGLTDSDNDGVLDSFTDLNTDGFDDGVALTNGTVVDSNGATETNNANGSINGNDADINDVGEYLTFDLGSSRPAGTIIGVVIRKPNGDNNSISFQIGEGTNSAGPFTNNQVFTPINSSEFLYYTIELDAASQFIRVEITSLTGGTLEIDAIFYNVNSPEDFDGDGLPDFLDIDTDNDGLTDNIEGQTTADFIIPTGADDDGDGIDNAYDVTGGTPFSPANSDTDAEPDYRDLNSDDNPASSEDGVLDQVEGFDANRNGFSDLDTNQDGILNETGFDTDTDGDGLLDIFDLFSGRGINNITGVGNNADLQDTDMDGIPDFRDTDDDNDMLLTRDEDVNGNNDFTDDKIQGGGATPDYLFFNDTDEDGVADGQDVDADNDGIPNDQEYDNVAVTFNPFGDEDGDGNFNYLDTTDPALASLTDANGDGIFDEFDTDLDGVPNFFDLDSDNDGIPDAVEANSGALPTGTDTNGQFPEDAPDDDNDGLPNSVDGSPNNVNIFNTNLPLNDTDGDGIPDFLDLDSDNDGIVDLVEAGGSDFDGNGQIDGFGDTDGDGLANMVDPDNGGTPLTIPNTDMSGLPNYIDLDSDGDGAFDFDEGVDDDEDGSSLNDLMARRAQFEANNSGDPSVYTTTNTDGDMTPDYLEDADGDGIPNYLDFGNPFYLDTDGDGIIDFYDPDQGGTSYTAPDNDGDGTPNIIDGSDVALPLDFIRFVGDFEDDEVILTWVTDNEIDNDRFEIERSFDGRSFEVIGTETPLNNLNVENTYEFVDRQPQFGANYYRIRQVDFDGQSTTTEIIVVFADAERFEFTIFPNPVQDKLKIKANFSTPEMLVNIVNLSGKTVYQQILDQDVSVEEASIDVSNFPAGIYYVLLKSGEISHQFKLLKN